MKILMTGGAGFIGSHTCVEVLESGMDIVVVDDFSNSKPEALNRIKRLTNKDFTSYSTNLLDFDGVCKIFEENQIDAVIHFAGFKAVGESVEKPLMYYHNNLSGTINLLRAMQKYNCKKIVFSSSATVYGMNNPIPYVETFPTSATNPYGYTKVMIEQILTDMCVADKDFTAILLRYFNPIGAHKSGLLGEDPNGIPNNLVPYICKVALGKLDHLNVFGNDYDTIDGTGVRDYIHVVDLAKGHVAALKYSLETAGLDAINLGTGKGTSVLEIVTSYEKACQKEIPRVFAPRRAGDIAEFYANNEKAKKLLNWNAELGIDEMCADSWNFTKNNPEGL